MSIVQAYTEAYRNYLFDESRTMGRADYIAFPRNEAELVEAVRFAHDNRVPLTAQGARTGLAGGASPQGGMILNLSRMNRILGIRRDEEGRFLLRVQPGVALTTVRKALKNKSFDVSGWDEESRETLKDVRAGALFFLPRSHRTDGQHRRHGKLQRLRGALVPLRLHAQTCERAARGARRRAGDAAHARARTGAGARFRTALHGRQRGQGASARL